MFTDTVIAFLRAQLGRLREPVGVLLLDDIPGMLSPGGFDRIALPYLQRVFDALLPRIGQLHCEVWNFSHEMDIAEAAA